VIIVADITKNYAVGFAAGVLIGAGFFLVGASKGGLKQVSLTSGRTGSKSGPASATTNTLVGCALAASGIASSVISDHQYAFVLRVIFVVATFLGVIISLIFSWRSRNNMIEGNSV